MMPHTIMTVLGRGLKIVQANNLELVLNILLEGGTKCVGVPNLEFNF